MHVLDAPAIIIIIVIIIIIIIINSNSNNDAQVNFKDLNKAVLCCFCRKRNVIFLT